MAEPENTQAVVAYRVTDARIAELGEIYLALKIAGVEDREGEKVVHDARIAMRDLRNDVETQRKALKADALAWGRAVDEEAKRIQALIAPIEHHLTCQEDAVKAEREELKRQAEEEKQRALKARCDVLAALGSPIHALEIAKMSDEEYEEAVAAAKVAAEKRAKAEAEERARKEAEEAAAREQREKEEAAKRKAEEERLAAERAELEEENRKLREAQATEAARVAAERAELERERRELREAEEARQREAEKERFAAEAAERAARVERERIEREQAEAAAEEKRKAERRARAEQLKPVKRRLETFAKSLRETPAPEGLPPAVAAALGDVLDRAADAVLVLAQGLEVRP